MKDAIVIANPASGGGRTGKQWSITAARLRAAGLDFDAALTTGPGHATEIAREAVREGRGLIVAAGGDGTINEVANGFFEAGEPVAGHSRLGVLPTGSGGDFRRTFGIPLDLEAGARVLAAGRTRRIDAGRVTFATAAGRSGVRHFVNIADAGIGGYVVDRFNRSRKLLGGPTTFSLVALGAFLRYRNQPLRVDVDGDVTELVSQQVVIANCRWYGGGMQVAPAAQPDDGLFEVITVGDTNFAENLRGLARIRNGTHLEPGNTKYRARQGRRIEVSSPETVLVDLDGEQPGRLPAVFEIQPGALNLVVP